MNQDDFQNSSDEQNIYHASSNMNTAIENPTVNINSVTNVNIKNDDVVENDNQSSFETNSNNSYSNQYDNGTNSVYQDNSTNINLESDDDVDFQTNVSSTNQYDSQVSSSMTQNSMVSKFAGYTSLSNEQDSQNENIEYEMNSFNEVNDQNNVENVDINTQSVDNYALTDDLTVDDSQNINVSASYNQVTPSHENSNDDKGKEVIPEKKNENNKIVIPREVKIMMFIVFILVIFILFMPYIYDFLKEFQLVVSG